MNRQTFWPYCRQVVFLVPFLLVALVVCGWATSCQGAELVTCRYLQSEGEKIVLELHIGSPPPAMLILIQRLPEGVTIRSATPPVGKFDAGREEAKWLLKRLQPGTMIFALELNQPVAANAVRGEIRYKDPVSGKSMTMEIKP